MSAKRCCSEKHRYSDSDFNEQDLTWWLCKLGIRSDISYTSGDLCNNLSNEDIENIIKDTSRLCEQSDVCHLKTKDIDHR